MTTAETVLQQRCEQAQTITNKVTNIITKLQMS